jgi:hypothetical protein
MYPYLATGGFRSSSATLFSQSILKLVPYQHLALCGRGYMQTLSCYSIVQGERQANVMDTHSPLGISYTAVRCDRGVNSRLLLRFLPPSSTGYGTGLASTIVECQVQGNRQRVHLKPGSIAPALLQVKPGRHSTMSQRG